MFKKKILIASVLKPVNDTRHYGKFAVSLAKTNKYVINIIAKGEKKASAHPAIRFIQAGNFERFSFKRIKIWFLFFRQVVSFNPGIILICTPELLPAAALIRIFYKGKVVYDIQENYEANLKYQAEYGTIARYIIRPLVRALHRYSNLVIDHFILAEVCYAQELKFIRKPFTVIENKALDIRKKNEGKAKETGTLKLLFSGTVSTYSGIEHALSIYRKIKTHVPECTLLIVGSAPDKRLGRRLKNESLQDPGIELFTDIHPIDHEVIVAKIKEADLGLITYTPNPVNCEKIPTKLYEYTALDLPYLVAENSVWAHAGKKYGGAIPVDLAKPDVAQILLKLKEIRESGQITTKNEVRWSEESAKLITLFNRLDQ